MAKGKKKQQENPFAEYQQKFFDAWTEQMAQVPGGDKLSEYQKQFFDAWNENMQNFPGVEQFNEYQEQFLENWNEQVAKLPGGDQFVEYQQKAQKQLEEAQAQAQAQLEGAQKLAKEQFELAQKQFSEYQKQLSETSKEYFDAWSEQMGKVPGMDSVQKLFDGMMPKADNIFDLNYWKGFAGQVPGMGEYWKNVSGMMPDPSSFLSKGIWPAKIPGIDTAAKVFDLWKGASDPATFARDYAEKYMDLMQDVFKGFLPEGSLAFMQRPMDFMDTLVNYYQQNFAPLMKVDDEILKRIAQGDLKAYTDFFRSFNEQYEETIGKYYNMMGLGLNRESNEDYMQALSAYNKAMFATGELMSLVMTTGAESMTELTSNMQKVLSEGQSLTTFREFYDLWSKTTEGELMKLFDTDEFAKTFDNFADMYSQYLIANNKVVERALSSLPIPTNSDMKSLYKTVYDLRKEVRDLKRELKELKAGTAKKK